MELHTTAFAPSEFIPAGNSCEGADSSPDLSWSGAPDETKSFALIVDDPDAPGGTYVHWVLFNIPAAWTSLPAGFPAAERTADGVVQGINDFGNTGYGGPCPPVGHGVHRYFFKFYALDTILDLGAGATKADLETAMDGHVLADARIMGRYERR